MVPMPPSRILARISYFPSISVAGKDKDGQDPRSDCNRTVQPLAAPGAGLSASRAARLQCPAMAATSSGEPAAAAGYSTLRTLTALFVSLRPAQWVKNLVLPLPFLFGGALGEARGWVLAVVGFAVFCVISSAIYLVNDVMDRERDRAHPVKRHRPLATGSLT